MLLKDESKIIDLKPHIIALWPFYAFFIYYILISAYILLNKKAIISWVNSTFLGGLEELGVSLVFMIIWWGILIIPAAIFSIMRIAWKWLILYFLLASFGTYTVSSLSVNSDYLFMMTIGLGILGILLTEIYRRSHTYTLTNYRVIMRVGFPFGSERDVFYTRITDIIVQKGFLGKLFNFGNIIPITASGIGTGTDQAHVAIGLGGTIPKTEIKSGTAVSGGKIVTVPRGRESYILFGVPNPDNIRKIIIDFMQSGESAPYLGKVVDMLENLVERGNVKK